MSLSKIRIRNLQRLANLTLVLDDRITTLVGKTDAGKSTVIRALALVCLSIWDKCYVRHGKKVVKVELTADDRVIVREKGKARNLYAMDGKKFRAFANSVPPQIADLLNVGPDNFQFQLDTHFWFGDTSGQVSKKLNQIVNLEVIDRTLANVAARVRESKAELSVCDRRVKEAREHVRKLDWVPELAEDFGRLEDLKDREERLRSSVLSGASLVANAQKYARRLKTSLETFNDAGRVLRALRRARRGARQIDTLGRLVADLQDAARYASLPEVDASSLTKLRKDGDALSERIRELEMLADELKDTETKICQLDEIIARHEKSITTTRCPICGALRSATSSPTCTSRNGARWHGPKKTSGPKSSLPASGSSAKCATRPSVPW